MIFISDNISIIYSILKTYSQNKIQMNFLNIDDKKYSAAIYIPFTKGYLHLLRDQWNSSSEDDTTYNINITAQKNISISIFSSQTFKITCF